MGHWRVGTVSVELGRQPVRDRRGPAWIGHGPDLLEALLVAATDAFVLAKVFIPGAHDELLEHTPGIGRVAPHAPTHRTRAPPGVASGVEGVNEVSLQPRPWPVLERHEHRPLGRARVPLAVLTDTIQPFPTFSEIYVAALKALRKEIAAGSKPADSGAPTPS